MQNLEEISVDQVDYYVSLCFDSANDVAEICNENFSPNGVGDPDESWRTLYERNYILSLAIACVTNDKCRKDLGSTLINAEIIKRISCASGKPAAWEMESYQKIKNKKKAISEFYCFPDFLFHQDHNPNNLNSEDQHLVLEAKTAKKIQDVDFFWDFFKLNVYVDVLHFKNAVYLIVNQKISKIDKLISKYKDENLFETLQKEHIVFLIQENQQQPPQLYKLK